MIQPIRKKWCSLLKKQQGFTLIEVVIAIMVISIVIAPVLVVISSLLFDSVVVEYMEIGTYLGDLQLERIHSLSFSQIANEGPTAFTGDFSDYSYQITTSAVPALMAANCASVSECMQVDIAISHTTVGTLFTVVTYVADF